MPSRWSVSCCQTRAASSWLVSWNGWPCSSRGVDGDAKGPGDVAGYVGDAQAALVAGVHLLGRIGKLWINKDPVIFWLPRRIGDKKPPAQPDLGGRQAHATGLVHELEHPGGDLPNLIRDLWDGLTGLTEHRIGVKDDFQGFGVYGAAWHMQDGMPVRPKGQAGANLMLYRRLGLDRTANHWHTDRGLS